MIGASGDAFTIVRIATLQGPNGETMSLHFGMRWMQEVFWNANHLSTCDCAKKPRIGDLFSPPRNCWVFGGIVGLPASKQLPNSDDRQAEASEIPWEVTTNPPKHARGLAAELDRAEYTPAQLKKQRVRLKARLPHQNSECRIHLGLTAGESMARWGLLSQSQWVDRGPSTGTRKYFNRWYLRPSDCCIECAIKTIRKQIQGDSNAYAHAGLIL